MAIPRTSLLDLPLPVTGSLSGDWGAATNNGLTEYLDIAVAGSLVLNTDADVTLTSTDGDENGTNIGSTTAQYAILRWTATGSTTRNITVPAKSKTYIVINATGGTQSIVLRGAGPTTGVTIVSGEKAVCAWNGSDFVKVGGAAGGSTTQVQYNNAGVFGGITNATTDGTTLSMTSPKVITGINDTNGAELLKVTATASAVNELTLANAAAGNAPTLSATGDDTNIGITLTPKGTGTLFTAGNVSFDGGSFVFNESGADKDFRIEGDTDANLFFTDASTDRVGIGTSSPSAKLDVAATEATIRLTSTTGTNFTDVRVVNTGGTLYSGIERSTGGVLGPTGAYEAFFIYGADRPVYIGTGNSYLRFGTNSTERMRLDSSGNLGLATTLQNGTRMNVMGGNNVPATSGSTQNGGLRISSLATGSGGYVLDMGVSDTNGYAWMQVSNSGNLASGFTKDLVLQPNGGNLGLGVTPSAWGSGYTAFDIKRGSVFQNSSSNFVGLANNAFHNGTNWIYKESAVPRVFRIQNDQFEWLTAASGTAGNTITFTQALTLDANRNLLLNGTSAGASAVGTLTIFNGTAPTGSVTDGIILYAQDVSSSSELKVRDEAGNVTTLSPHNFSLIPDGPSEDMAWAYYSEKGGKRINVDMLKLARMVEKLTGEKLVYES